LPYKTPKSQFCSVRPCGLVWTGTLRDSLHSPQKATGYVLPRYTSSSSLLLSNLKLSDTKVYEPQVRALLETASHFCPDVRARRDQFPIKIDENDPSPVQKCSEGIKTPPPLESQETLSSPLPSEKGTTEKVLKTFT